MKYTPSLLLSIVLFGHAVGAVRPSMAQQYGAGRRRPIEKRGATPRHSSVQADHCSSSDELDDPTVLTDEFLKNFIDKMVAVAKSYEGEQEDESKKDNFGKTVKSFTRGQEGKPWCLGFVLTVLDQTKRNFFPDSKKDIVPFTLSNREFLAYAKRHQLLRPRGSVPQRGDIMITGPHDGYYHASIITATVQAEDGIITVSYIGGNVPPIPNNEYWKRDGVRERYMSGTYFSPEDTVYLISTESLLSNAIDGPPCKINQPKMLTR